MNPVIRSISEARKAVSLRPKSAVAGEIRARLTELESKGGLESIERYAAAVARKALFDLSRVAGQEDGISMVAAWIRMSLSEPVDERRLMVSQMGSVLLCTDFQEPNGSVRK